MGGLDAPAASSYPTWPRLVAGPFSFTSTVLKRAPFAALN